MVQKKLSSASLVERKDITSDLFIIKLQPEDGPFQFKPGQYCTLGLEGIERAYSIVSAPYEPLLEIFVELVPEGEMTPLLWKMKVGDKLSIRPRAKGLFKMDQRVHHHFMLATVTGVAPYISIIRDYIYNSGQDHMFYVLLAASYQDELTYEEELAGLASDYSNFIKFVPTVSRPNEARNSAWKGVRGRVNLIAEEYLEKYNLPQDDSLVYLCGHPGMINDAKDRIAPNGWKFIEERFWKE
jgi:ferredoxin--NADP+ reductase